MISFVANMSYELAIIITRYDSLSAWLMILFDVWPDTTSLGVMRVILSNIQHSKIT